MIEVAAQVYSGGYTANHATFEMSQGWYEFSTASRAQMMTMTTRPSIVARLGLAGLEQLD